MVDRNSRSSCMMLLNLASRIGARSEGENAIETGRNLMMNARENLIAQLYRKISNIAKSEDLAHYRSGYLLMLYILFVEINNMKTGCSAEYF